MYGLVLFSILIMIQFASGLVHAGDKQVPASYEVKLLGLINEYRLKDGLNPLPLDKTLNRFAEKHSREMALTGKLGHAGFESRYRESGRTLCVENVGWNFTTPGGQLQAWKNSRGHNVNLLNRQIKHAGISKIGSYVTFFACD